MDSLENSGHAAPATLWHFARLLVELGFGIDLGVCSECGRAESIEHFDVAAGGAFCSRCALPSRQYFPLAARHARAIGRLFAEIPPLPSDPPLAHDQVQTFFLLYEELVVANLDFRPRSFAFLAETLALGPVVTPRVGLKRTGSQSRP